MFSAEDLVVKIAAGVAGSSIVGTGALTQDSGIELSVVLWLVGGLLSIIALLLAAIGYFIRDMRNQNAEQHKALAKSYTDISMRLMKLETEHSVAFAARGCAYEPERQKELVRALLNEIKHEDTVLRERDKEDSCC